ncbi:MAG: hypothetical protein U9R38_06095 [Candidatus Margulisiibacteriota bacterium]|nr:hypothetical protein [Candidatus Margulisiibacteriota bacterium]
MNRTLLIACCFIILPGVVFAQAPEFRYEPPGKILYWAPPPEFVITDKEWSPPPGFEEYAQPWGAPPDWGAPEEWGTETEFE